MKGRVIFVFFRIEGVGSFMNILLKVEQNFTKFEESWT